MTRAVTGMNPPRLTASPMTRSTSSRTTTLLPAAIAHSNPPAVTLPRLVVAARNLAMTLVLAEPFADDRGRVLDGQVEDDQVPEDVDDVGRAGADPPTQSATWRTR